MGWHVPLIYTHSPYYGLYYPRITSPIKDCVYEGEHGYLLGMLR